MSFYLLPNTLGDLAYGAGGNAVPGLATGYSGADGITGPRSTRVRFQAYLGARNYGYFHSAATFSATHMVIARADWLITKTGARVRPLECTDDSPISYAVVAGSDFNPLTAASLIGVRSQDLVMATPITNQYGGGFQWTSTATEAEQYSKLYVSNAFDFGASPDIKPFPEWQVFPETEKRYFTPQRGTMPYQIEAQISLTWRNVTRAKMDAFRALPRLLEWPIFLYDDAGDYWSWKLEHVLISDWEETLTQYDLSDITIRFVRLKHYA